MDVLLDGLRRLEYRGYDSAGLALLEGERIAVVRTAGKIAQLAERLNGHRSGARLGIGHTRWATHGPPTERNAHPHRDCTGRVAVVHNGIIENFLSLRERLRRRGHRFRSETDTEVVAHLLEEQLGREDPLEALELALRELEGSYALAAISPRWPGLILAARRGSPLVVGVGQGECLLASDIPALLPYTREVIVLEDGEVALVRPEGPRVLRGGRPQHRSPHHVSWDVSMAERGGYRHFMLKEIMEQPRAVRDTVRPRVRRGRVVLEELGLTAGELRRLRRVYLVACGTSYHAALLGKLLIERWARVPCEADIASEFRYRDPVLDPRSLTLVISQSGETADTLAALREVKERGCKAVAICNVVGSTIARESDGVIYTHAGPEIGVASTKAFTTQLACLYLLALRLAEVRGEMPPGEVGRRIEALQRVPQWMEEVLSRDGEIQQLARAFWRYAHFLYLGRGINWPLAMEGALKLKEISYIHAEAYPAGEMKHGPIALIDPDFPTLVLATRSGTYEKTLGNVEEVKARDGKVIALVTRGDELVARRADHVLELPPMEEEAGALVAAVPLQLFAYHVAVRRGCDVDQPRNLAKSVTVE